LDARKYLIPLLLVLLVFAAFLPALELPQVLEDGPVVLAREEMVRGGLAEVLGAGYLKTDTSTGWRPMATLSFWATNKVLGRGREGHAAVQILIRGAVVVLLYLILLRFTKDLLISGLWSLLAGLHPATSEGIFRLSGRGEALGVFFLLLAVLGYLRLSGERDRGAKGRPLNLGKIYGGYLAALLSDEKTWFLPLVFLGTECLRRRRPTLGREGQVVVLPMAGILILWVLARVLLPVPKGSGLGHGIVEWMGLGTRMLATLGSFGHLAILLVWPSAISTSHVHILNSKGVPGMGFVLSGAVLLALLLWAMLRAQRAAEGTRLGLLLTLLAAVAVLPVGRWSGPLLPERSLLPLAAGLALAAGDAHARLRVQKPGLRWGGVAILVLLVSGSALVDWNRAGDFAAPGGIIEADLARHPGDAELLTKKATLEIMRGQYEAAQKHLLDATERLSIDPRAWINLGITFHAQKDYGFAVRSYAMAGKILEGRKAPKDIAYRYHYHLGLALMQQGRNADAAEHLERALEIRPRSVPVLANLGMVYAETPGMLERSAQLLREALRLDPDEERKKPLKKILRDVENLLERKGTGRRRGGVVDESE
jgi:tetratricopeptide (TPR) repeat protein